MKEQVLTKTLLVGSDVKSEVGLENAPIDWRLAVEMVRIPATKAVTAKAVVAKIERTLDIMGAESVKRYIHWVREPYWGKHLKGKKKSNCMVHTIKNFSMELLRMQS